MLNINLQEDILMNVCTGVKLQISEHRMKQLSMITVHKIQEQKSNEITQFNTCIIIYISSTNICITIRIKCNNTCEPLHNFFNTQDWLKKEGYSQEITKQHFFFQFCLKT